VAGRSVLMMRAPLLCVLLLALPARAVARPLEVKAVPERVVLGRDLVVLVRVAVPPGAPPLRAAASSGRLRAQPPSPQGEAVFSWTPPDIRYPLLAVLAFWVEPADGGPPDLTTLSVPLVGRTVLDVATNTRGAQVVVQVADANFGPFPTDRRGRAHVPVEVPPGVREARVLATSKRQRSVRTIPLDVPPEQPLLALLSPPTLPPGGTGWLVTRGTEPVPGAALRLKPRGLRLEERTPGVFHVQVEPGVESVAVEMARVDGTASARVEARVAPPPPVQPPPPLVVPLVWNVPPPTRPVKPPPPPTPPPSTSRASALALHLLAGGFRAGGDNTGPQAALGLGARLPGLGGRVWLEGEVDLSRSTSHLSVESLGTLDARVFALPVLLAVRGRAFELGRLSLEGRLGGGAVYYDHRATGTFFDTPSEQRGWTSMGFIAVQAAWKWGVISPLVELRGALSQVSTPRVEARFGGLSACVGVRLTP
jgi:hypothetical protein